MEVYCALSAPRTVSFCLSLINQVSELSRHRSLAPTSPASAYSSQPSTNSIAQDTRLQDHERLGHISFKRMRQLDIDGITPPTSKCLKSITCPVCITAKARGANRPAPSTPADRPTEPWQDVHTDLSGKVRTASVTGAKYFAVFIDSYSGSKHIEFMNSKNALSPRSAPKDSPLRSRYRDSEQRTHCLPRSQPRVL